MALWLVRAGKYGEHEARFFEDSRVYLTFADLSSDNLSALGDYDAVRTFMATKYPDDSNHKVGNLSGQVWAFTAAMKPGDWVVVPSKTAPTIAIGEVLGGYVYRSDADAIYRHSRDIKWLNMGVPRSSFDQDLLYSMGAFLTVCEVKRNDAEKRVRALAKLDWKAAPLTGKVQVPAFADPTVSGSEGTQNEPVEVDLEELSRDAISKLIAQKFKGHGMARLVEAILKAQGFATHRSPEGPDKGIDILASGGPFGFDHPRICVQVKSGDTPADRPEFTQLVGAMQSVGADNGLFVSWGGFKPTVLKEVPTQFFKVRVWNEKDLVEQLLLNYDKLDQDIRTELPLKRVWMIASSDE